jgi:hypothetical protein
MKSESATMAYVKGCLKVNQMITQQTIDAHVAGAKGMYPIPRRDAMNAQATLGGRFSAFFSLLTDELLRAYLIHEFFCIDHRYGKIIPQHYPFRVIKDDKISHSFCSIDAGGDFNIDNAFDASYGHEESAELRIEEKCKIALSIETMKEFSQITERKGIATEFDNTSVRKAVCLLLLHNLIDLVNIESDIEITQSAD